MSDVDINVYNYVIQLIQYSCSDPVAGKYIDFEQLLNYDDYDDYEGSGSRDYSNYDDIVRKCVKIVCLYSHLCFFLSCLLG